jgi:hypothetical protein
LYSLYIQSIVHTGDKISKLRGGKIKEGRVDPSKEKGRRH